MGTTSGYITRNQDLIINMDAANSRSYTSGSTTCECLVSTVEGVLENGTSFSPEYNGGWTFDGTNDYLNLGDRVNINPELNSFTCNVFFKIDPSSNNTNIIASKGNNSSGDIGWMIYYHSINEALTVRCNGNDAVSQRAGQHIPINKGQVYMVTLVINRTDNTIKGYLNGSNVGWVDGNYNGVFTGNSISGFGSITNSDDFLIGERPFLNLPMFGTIYLFQTYNFALSESQVYRNFRFFGGRYDLSVPPPTFFNDYSFEFDGTDDYFATDLTIPSVMLGNFSMSFWIKMVPVSLGTYLRKHPVAVSTSVTAIDQTVHVRAWNTQYLVRQIGSLGGTGGVGTTDLSDNNWHHIAYTYTYDGGTTYYTVNIYVDGNATPEVTSTMRTTGGYQTQGLYSIGVLTNWNKTLYSGTEFPGLIDEITGWDSALSTADIATLAGGPNNPTTALSVVPIAWYRMGDNGIYKSPQWLIANNENKDKISNYSMSFDGTDDYIDCGNGSSLQPTSEITLSAWFMIPTASLHFGADTLISQDHTGYAGTHNGYSLEISIASNGYLYALFRLDDGTTSHQINVATNVGPHTPYVGDVWYHLLGTWDGTTMTLYLNGDTIGTTTAFSGTIGYDSSQDTLIGRRGHGQTNYFIGSIDDVSIFNTSKSPSEIISIYNSGIPGDLSAESGLVGYWKMGEDATFSTNWAVPDQIGSNDGTSANMDIYDRVGDAPGSSGNTVSYNMVLSGRTTDVPT